ncbi:hypothetical protein E2C01_031456 [Portunus trituberculatus]|uniref:Uncharacterized protein n=1 Tax=Portunus trituberculatus TaxID=210409 RepID=A0A5B7ETH5_PORTR|nr:hypothetical protein [Portunus trituberculatus]
MQHSTTHVSNALVSRPTAPATAPSSSQHHLQTCTSNQIQYLNNAITINPGLISPCQREGEVQVLLQSALGQWPESVHQHLAEYIGTSKTQ